MIYTSNYDEHGNSMYLTYSISGDRGKKVNYEKRCYSKLAPKKSFWEIWHNNIGKISEEENNKYYVEEYFKEVLSKLDPESVYNELNHSILLCYEKNTDFCHRHIVAAWFELFLDITIPEINKQLEVMDRPEYIKENLEKIIKNNVNMRGFNSLRALYLFEKSEHLEEKANQYEENTGIWYSYKQSACYLRCEADIVEDKYMEQKELVKSKKIFANNK